MLQLQRIEQAPILKLVLFLQLTLEILKSLRYLQFHPPLLNTKPLPHLQWRRLLGLRCLPQL
jgi:hypothetical protein